MKFKAITLAALAVLHIGAQADTRFDYYCVTTPGDDRTVFIYDDLIESYASKGDYVPFTYLRRVTAYKTHNPLPNKLNRKAIQADQARRIEYRNADFAGRWDQDGVLSISWGRAVEATRSTITISEYEWNEAANRRIKSVHFQLPFLTESDKLGEVRMNGLIFDGHPVSSVIVQDCGSGAD